MLDLDIKGIKQQQKRLISENKNTQKCCEGLNKQIASLNTQIADCKRAIKELQRFNKMLLKNIRRENVSKTTIKQLRS